MLALDEVSEGVDPAAVREMLSQRLEEIVRTLGALSFLDRELIFAVLERPAASNAEIREELRRRFGHAWGFDVRTICNRKHAVAACLPELGALLGLNKRAAVSRRARDRAEADSV